MALIAFTREFTIVDIFRYVLGEGLDGYVNEKLMDNCQAKICEVGSSCSLKDEFLCDFTF
jgi:hypothetical protein